MPGKMARSASRPPFGLPDALVAVCTSRRSCRKAGKARIFTPVWELSGESRLRCLSLARCICGDSWNDRGAIDKPLREQTT